MRMYLKTPRPLASLVLAWCFLLNKSPSAQAQNQLQNVDEVFSFAAAPNKNLVDLSHLRVAIIDQDFSGFERYGRDLGDKVKLVEIAPQRANLAKAKHGFAMAQIFMAASGALKLPPTQRPQLYLVRAFSYSEFKKAIDFCLGDKNSKPVDLVIHSNNYEWGTDFMGGGFYNALVSHATSRGITWINSAGNTGRATYFSPSFRTNKKDEVLLPEAQNTLIFENRLDDQSFKIVLSWSDFTDDVGYATKKDLDFEVFALDPNGRLAQSLGTAANKQIGKHPKETGTGYSGNAFESLDLSLPDRGTYAIKIYDRSRNFDGRDRWQIQIEASNPEALNFISHNRLNELLAPADNESVISVGVEGDFSAMRLLPGTKAKPDIIVKANLGFIFSDGAKRGMDTSSAAALYGGIFARQLAVQDMPRQPRWRR